MTTRKQPQSTLFARGGPRFFLDSTAGLSLEVDAAGNIVFSQEQIGVARTEFNELNAPYDAKVVGDYTGLTAAVMTSGARRTGAGPTPGP